MNLIVAVFTIHTGHFIIHVEFEAILRTNIGAGPVGFDPTTTGFGGMCFNRNSTLS